MALTSKMTQLKMWFSSYYHKWVK